MAFKEGDRLVCADARAEKKGQEEQAGRGMLTDLSGASRLGIDGFQSWAIPARRAHSRVSASSAAGSLASGLSATC